MIWSIIICLTTIFWMNSSEQLISTSYCDRNAQKEEFLWTHHSAHLAHHFLFINTKIRQCMRKLFPLAVSHNMIEAWFVKSCKRSSLELLKVLNWFRKIQMVHLDHLTNTSKGDRMDNTGSFLVNQEFPSSILIQPSKTDMGQKQNLFGYL